MAVWTMFGLQQTIAMEGDTADERRFARSFDTYLSASKLNILTYKIFDYVLDAEEAISPVVLWPDFQLTDWFVMFAFVDGRALFSLSQNDPTLPLPAPISLYTEAYGNQNMPGIATISTSLVDLGTFAVTGKAAGTKVKFIVAKAAADNNADWIANK